LVRVRYLEKGQVHRAEERCEKGRNLGGNRKGEGGVRVEDRGLKSLLRGGRKIGLKKNPFFWESYRLEERSRRMTPTKH